MRRKRVIWSGLVILGLAIGLGLVWHKSASATHNCTIRPGGFPFGGRGINCTYYLNAPVHPVVGELFNQGSWNWPFGYNNEGLVPNNAYSNSDTFINVVRSYIWACGFHPTGINSCPGTTTIQRRERFGRAAGNAFMVDTMLGQPGQRFEPTGAPPYNNYALGGIAYAQDNFDTWANRIRDYEAAGLISWDQLLTHAQVANVPGPQCGGVGGRSDTVVFDLNAFGMDQAIYNNTYCETAHYMTFRHPTTNQPIYRINRLCGNVTGNMAALPPVPSHDFNATPTGNVTISPSPEDPDSATFYSGVSYGGAPFQAQLAWNYFILRNGSTVEERLTIGNETRTFTGSSYSRAPPTTISLVGQNLRGGDRVCNRTRITPAAGQASPTGVVTSITTATAVTEDICITIVDRPYQRVYGGDVFAGAGFSNGTGCSTDQQSAIIGWNRGSDPYLGAGSQLGTFALGTIVEFASGTLRNRNLPKSQTFANANPSFNNWGVGAYGGGLDAGTGNAICAADYWADATGIQPGGYTINTARTLGLGQRQVVYVDGDVFINANITYVAGAYTDVNQIPSFRIVARGNIYVAPGVTDLSGVYIAMPRAGSNNTGRFYTCWPGRIPTNADINGPCRANRLTVYGAVVAELIKFTRSQGTVSGSTIDERYDSGTGTPAEMFIYTPEVWLVNGFGADDGAVDSIVSQPPIL
jgi:hypothetical protein